MISGKPLPAKLSRELKRALAGLSTDLDWTARELKRALATLSTDLDWTAIEAVGKRFKIAAKDPRAKDDLDVVDSLSFRQLEAIGRLLLPGRRGRSTKADDKHVAKVKKLMAEGVSRGEAIALVAPECDANSVASAKRRLRRRIPK